MKEWVKKEWVKNVGKDGYLYLPKELGVKEGDVLLVERLEEGVLLRRVHDVAVRKVVGKRRVFIRDFLKSERVRIKKLADGTFLISPADSD